MNDEIINKELNNKTIKEAFDAGFIYGRGPNPMGVFEIDFAFGEWSARVAEENARPCLRCGRPERVNRYHCEQCHEETSE